MAGYSEEKRLILALYHDLDRAGGEAVGETLASVYAPNHVWRGFHPFHQLHGAAAVSDTFWQPLKSALGHLQRRQDVFMAGANEIDGFSSVWVVSMGHLMGLFERLVRYHQGQ